MKVIFASAAGELDSRVVVSPVDAVRAIVEMVESAGEVHAGDRILVFEDGVDGVDGVDARRQTQ